jgi:ATP-dependent Lon protease
MSKATVPVLGISHRVVFPGSSHRVTISNFSERNPSSVSRGKKISMFGVVTYKDPDKRTMFSYGTLVGIAHESPISRTDGIFSSFFNSDFNRFTRSDWQLIIVGVERFRVLSITEDSSFPMASIQIEKDTDSNVSEKLVQELRTLGKNYLKGLNINEQLLQE